MQPRRAVYRDKLGAPAINVELPVAVAAQGCNRKFGVVSQGPDLIGRGLGIGAFWVQGAGNGLDSGGSVPRIAWIWGKWSAHVHDLAWFSEWNIVVTPNVSLTARGRYRPPGI